MWPDLQYGTVIFCKDYPFKDGKSDKLILVLGVTEGAALIAMTTSQSPTPDINPGCEDKRGLFKVQVHARDCFEKDTYIQLYRMGELLPKHVESDFWKTNAKIIGVLSEHTTNAIRKCVEYSDDISPRHRALLGKRRVAAPVGVPNAQQASPQK